jgi:hypothetical protein
MKQAKAVLDNISDDESENEEGKALQENNKYMSATLGNIINYVIYVG